MSTILSCSLDLYNIVICDTRITTFNAHGEKSSNDENLKIHYIENYGYFTGIGIGQLARGTFDFFKEQRVKNEMTLHSAFIRAYESIHNDDNGNDEVCAMLNQSAVFVSSKEKITAFSHSFQMTTGSEQVCLKRNQINIQYPYDIGMELREIIGSSTQLTDDWGIERILLLMLETFKTISNNSEDVSDICNVAIMGKNMGLPFFVQGKVSDVIENIRNMTFYGLENQFEHYKEKLLEWNDI